jgi:hypothetical protein
MTVSESYWGSALCTQAHYHTYIAKSGNNTVSRRKMGGPNHTGVPVPAHVSWELKYFLPEVVGRGG